MPKSKPARKPRKPAPMRLKVPVVLDGDVLDLVEEARDALDRRRVELQEQRPIRVARLVAGGSEPALAELLADQEIAEELGSAREAVDAAERAARDATESYVFEALGRARYADLIAAHPPTDEDHERTRKEMGDQKEQADWCRDTFLPALIQASCVSPQLTADDVKAMSEEWNDAEWDAVVTAALFVQHSRRIPPARGSLALTG